MESARQELERTLASSADSLLVCDSVGRIIGVSDSLCTLTGYDRQDLLAKRIDELAEPDAGRLADGLGVEATVDLEAGVRCKDGTTKRLRLRLRPLRIAGRPHSEVRVARQRRASDRLPEDPEFVRVLLRSAGIPLVCVRPDGTAVFANAAFEELVGRPFSEIRGRKIWELVGDPVLAALRRHLDSPDFPDGFETPWISASGFHRRIAWTAAWLAPDPPEPPLRLLIGRELGPASEPPPRPTPRRPREEETRVRQLEERIARLTADLEAARREHETFTYALAHECRAPIRAVTGLSDLLLERFDQISEDGPDADTVLRIVHSAHHLNSLVDALLLYNRLGRIDVRAEAQSVDALLGEVLRSFDSDIRDCRARITIESDGAAVLADRALLFLLLVQLVSNALKFVRPGIAPEVSIRAEPRAGVVRLRVKDNGIGIAPELHGVIFRLGERLHPGEAYPGTGMGLALAARAAERLGSRVHIDSREGEGSVFWVDLPRAPHGGP